MENKKTISYLNSKGWYRLLKVIFGICFLIVLVIFNAITFSSGIKKIEQSETMIHCNVKDKQTFTAQSLNITLSNNDFPNSQFDYKKFFGGLNDYTIKSILTACSPKVFTGQQVDDIYDVQKGYEILNKADVLSIVISDNNQSERDKAVNTAMEKDYLPYKNQTGNLFGSSKMAYLDFSFKIFDITPVFTYNSFLELFFIGNIVIFLIFEAIRRIFYYIVSGKISPEK